MFERIRHVVIKEFIQLFRDRRMKAIIFVVPIVQLIVFGYAVTTDVKEISTAVYDLDRSSESRELVSRLGASGYFSIGHHVSSPAEIQDLMDRGDIAAALQIDHGFSSDIKRGRKTAIQLLVDGTDSNTATVAMDYANRIIMTYSEALGPVRSDSRISRIELRERAWYNPELRSKYYNVPGVIAFVIMLTCLLLTSMAVVREREIGTMEQLMVTPIRPIEFILGKTIPFAMIGFFDMLLVTAIALLRFDIPMKGSFLLLLLATAIYLLSVLGIGLFISTIARTQQQALMATFLFYVPAVLLSGFMFPIENMPEMIQYSTYINPLRYFLVIIRNIFLKGSDLPALWTELLSLLILGAMVITISSLRFRKRMG